MSPQTLFDLVDAEGVPERGWVFLIVLTVLMLAVAALVIVIVELVVRLSAPRHPWTAVLLRHTRRALRLLLIVVAVWIAVDLAAPETRFSEAIDRALTIGVIGLFAWVLVETVDFAFEGAKSRFPIGADATRGARRAHTQLTFLQRLVTVVIIVAAVSAGLLTFPEMQALGASLLASAGLAGIVAGLAAQSTLSNVFAGVQIAFSDAIRVDDIVIVEGEWGRIEEITLTYVVVRIWDDRRLVVPSTHFTSTPFENWTRTGSELLGSVELDLDWRVSPAAMRSRLAEILDGTPLWDRRVSVLQVADAVGGLVRVRILVSAADAGSLFDLRNYVREQLVEWVQLESPGAMPRTRVVMVDRASADDAAPAVDPADQSAKRQLFSGTPEAHQRAEQMLAPSADPDAPSRAGA
ncbi:mechanosensitive ion channel family protein [Microcella humidisoli]|jgi:small-conductance mechanosensitive channel|uniref:Mechanosensitive ion channel family protein n=1 Tax=Microcella humidisoli TaxID=2963406 RepID=A0ABY5FYL3_9MICO|nr:mechanosensitive ion channel domain-containing protein [Microcella humidisoli]UTT63389.1 mechanosensitive ion channel family protein [Microcella humidisoli]